MAIRQLGEPVDLNASVPKIGVIQPGKYMDVLRQRFQPIAERGQIEDQFVQYQVMKKDAEAQQAAYDAALKARDSAQSAVSNFTPPNLSLGSGMGAVGNMVTGDGNTVKVAYIVLYKICLYIAHELQCKLCRKDAGVLCLVFF